MIIKNSADEIQNYLVDASNTKGYCDSVYFPENENDIITILREANSRNIDVTISGNRTGLTGAAVPDGGIVISMERMNRIREINTAENFALVEPGVILSTLQSEVEKKGLIYPPDPTERNCFIGGTVATNASGAQSFYYGATRGFVIGLEVILPIGGRIILERNNIFADDLKLKLKTVEEIELNVTLPEYNFPATKNAAGYFCRKGMDAIDLFIGSEGTLGVITKIKLKLLPKPEEIISVILFFNDEPSAFNFLNKARILSKKNKDLIDQISALSLEYFDQNALEFLRDDYPKIPESAKAAIWFEQIVNGNRDKLTEQWLKLFASAGGNENDAWYAINFKEKEEIKNFRHSISAKVNEFITQNNFRKLGTDTAVPENKLEEYYHFLKKIMKEQAIKYVIYGHFGDSHIHLNMLPKSDEQFERGKNIYTKICIEALRLGGTFSAEHGVGKNKTKLLLEMYGNEVVQKMKEIKRTLDPNLIMCKNNIFNF